MQKSQLERQLLGPNERLTWAPELDGIAAFSLLWDRSALLVASATEGSSPNDSHYFSEVIALPGSSRQLVQNWVEIIDWMSTITNVPVLLEATLINDSEDSTPAVRIQQIGNLPITPSAESSSSTTANTQNADVWIERTQAWVKRVLVEQGICPFTKSVKKSGQGLADVGVPVGSIAYHGSSASHPIQLFADTWRVILEMISAGPKGKDGVSSILLTAPAFDDDFDFWAGPIFAMLEAGVVAAQAQAEIGVVCFHPRYATPDGKTWPGFGHMHSVPRLEKWYQEHYDDDDEDYEEDDDYDEDDDDYDDDYDEDDDDDNNHELTTDQVAAGGAWQRRTPHATINVLRADQLEAAESKRSSGSLYAVNIEKLVGTSGIGSDKLAQDLEQERQIGCPVQQ